MKKNVEKLIERFKTLEKEIVEILNEKPAYFDENDEKSLVKKSLREYIKKVNKAKKLFAEYETIAKEIEDINADDDESAALSKLVLNFREMPAFESAELEQSEEITELKNDKQKHKKGKQLKKEKETIKEF